MDEWSSGVLPRRNMAEEVLVEALGGRLHDWVVAWSWRTTQGGYGLCNGGWMDLQRAAGHRQGL